MYAVIETGGKQYRVEVGTELEVELLDAKAGDAITLERVLLVADGDEAAIGRPLVTGATVSAEVVRQDRAPKVISFKYRPKARRRVKKGHRQDFHLLRITDVVLNGKSAAAVLEKARAEAKTERERLEEAAQRQAAEDAALAAKLTARSAPKADAKDAKGAKATAKDSKSNAGADSKPAAKAAAKSSPAKPATKADAGKPAAKSAVKPAAKSSPPKPAARADAAKADTGKTAPKPAAKPAPKKDK
ncbi:MAG: 50S ribosomal protein L21 [Candidatus Limnocylindrales bacterium]